MEHALWFVGPRQVSLRPYEPGPLHPDEVRVRTTCSGVSAGTELLAYRGELPTDLPVDEAIDALGDADFTYPFQYGYSAVGAVESIGEAVDGLAPGDQVFAFQPHQQTFDAPPSRLLPVPHLDPRHAVLLPYVETALQVTLDAGAVFAETVVVTGLGVLGTLVAQLLDRAGATVLAVETQGWRRHLAGRLGIRAVAPDELAEALGAEPVHLGVECSGNPAALRTMLAMLAHEGTALVASWYGTKPVELPLGLEFHRRRLLIRSSQVSTIPARLSGRWTNRRRLEHAAELAATLPLGELATDTIPFERADAAYAALDAGTEGVFHVALGYR